MTVSQALAALLAAHGVDRVFGFPGDSTLPFYAGVAATPGIEHTVARCQKCAGYMADAYARMRSGPAVCDAPGGIGSTLLPPALHEAANSSSPVIAVTAATSRSQAGRWPTSECDQRTMLGAVVKETIDVEDPRRLAEYVRNAVIAATSPRSGPVHLQVPEDLLTETTLVDRDDLRVRPAAAWPAVRSQPVLADLERCLELVAAASAPMILAGGGVLMSGAGPALSEFASRWLVPVCTTVTGKGALAETSDPCAVGVVGAKGHPLVSRALAQADLVLCVGTKLGDKAMAQWSARAGAPTVIHLDSDPRELGRNLQAGLALLGDARATLEALGRLGATSPALGAASAQRRRQRLGELRAAIASFDKDFVAGARGAGRLRTATVINWLNDALPGGAVVAVDAGPPSGWIGGLYRTKAAGRQILASRGSGSLGWGLPAAIGARLAVPAGPVVGIGGDAGFAMASHELELLARARLDLTYVILDNQGMAMMNQIAERSLGTPGLFAPFAPVRWSDVATAYGCDGVRAEDESDLDALTRRLRSPGGPLIVQVLTEPWEITHDLAMREWLSTTKSEWLSTTK